MIVMIAVIAEKKKRFNDRSDRSDHMETRLKGGCKMQIYVISRAL